MPHIEAARLKALERPPLTGSISVLLTPVALGDPFPAVRVIDTQLANLCGRSVVLSLTVQKRFCQFSRQKHSVQSGPESPEST